MMENREYLNSLFDIYKDLLTITEQTTFTDYYIEDLSLQEIADNKNISKSSVGKTLKSATEKLQEYESKLHIYTQNKRLKEALKNKNYTLIEKIIGD